MGFDCLDTTNIVGFDWDDGNFYKNEKKHGVSWQEIEEVFFNSPLILLEDNKHSQYEMRCIAYGISDKKKKLMVVFTNRNKKIRVISARAMSKKERLYYEKI
jgi:uncharacterized DUF497 family protein